MIVFSTILIISVVAFFIGYNFLASLFQARQREAAEEHEKLLDQVSRLEYEKRELSNELNELEKKYTFLKHDIKATARLAAKLSTGEEESSLDVRMGDYMLTQGMITLEQHDKVMKVLPQMHMDFASACLALGYIDDPTAGAVQKQIRK